ncbi:BspA family leucine-rich repeat surface protein [Fructilactobacillus lindneri]|uniref:Gram-positive cocci surface proteins LPxTG domain-containing protein n=2 Tax=Fructilactobacillus lindneri TaxID=53444 RepID=A0A0R2JP04_9LACO|nr:BspA family leucine-rich repeat surface protein [Fructilactobacillus lindneri]ANZ57722.1 hypothetical protein AYR60_02565 [Fructilactobacillus lindneri]ANZ58992.1 hypothetical protein AYR59_02565 [Fructilactobacillus lindneri]KRN78840.1 hypothetical protein IV52_GL001120 [Fructilactobacillus lindneri DSM 20690 = JCM 11027]POG98017.1 hypothetical protein BGL31_04780 [Fructilactobacillus lindneri]POG99085.1 hypothetical protein BGL32_06005 [Fructilactobacillus lindneri]
MLRKQKKDETRLHYKMYKAGKFWFFSSIATLAVGTGLIISPNVSASDNTIVAADNQNSNDKLQTTSNNTTDQSTTTIKNDEANNNDKPQNSNNNKITELNQKDVATTTPDPDASENNKLTNPDSSITTKQSNSQDDTENKEVTQPSEISNDQQVKAYESNQNNQKQPINTPDVNKDSKNNLPNDKVQAESSQSAKATTDTTASNQTGETSKQVPVNPTPVITNNDQANVIPNAPITTSTENNQRNNSDQTTKSTTNSQPEADATAVENDNNLPNDALKITTPTNINIANTDVSADDQRNKNVFLAAENPNNTDALTGTWGTVNWSYDNENNKLSLNTSGTLGTRDETGSPFTNQKIVQNVKEIDVNAQIKLPSDSSNLFTTLPVLTSINGLDKFDSSAVTNMNAMFYNDYKLTNLDVSNWDTSKVTSMSRIFQSCGSLEYLNVGGKFGKNTGNVTNMSYMFCGLFTSGSPFDGPNIPRIGLTKITGIEELDTHNVTDMSFMFNGDQLLDNLNVSNFNTENVINMEAMFKFVYVPNLNLENFNTDKVTNMKEMFFTDNLLNSLNLSNFNTRNVTDMTNMLGNTVVLTYDDNQNIVSFGLWQLILGKDTILNNTVGLTDIVTGTLIPPTIDLTASGLWQELGTGELPSAPYITYSDNYSPNGQSLNAYTLTDRQSHAGTWVWAVDLIAIDGKPTDAWYANSEKAKNWTPEDEIKSLTNPDGSQTINKEQIQQAISDGILTVQYETENGKQVNEDILRTTPGKYNVIYNWYGSPNYAYQGNKWYYKTFTCVVTVKGTKTVTETGTGLVNVEYQYSDGTTAATTVTKSATFQRTNVVDDTTGAVISYGEWSPATTSVSVNSPIIKGYKPNPQTVSTSLTAGQNETIIVIYTANDETAKVQYIDDTTGKTIDGVADTALTGKYGQAVDKSTVAAEIKNLENQGYQYVSSNVPNIFDFDGEIPTYSVRFKHATEQVNDSTTGSLTVHYQYDDGKATADTVTKQVDFSRSGTKDQVTGNVAWNDWSPATINVSIDSPSITGYTADEQIVTDNLTAGKNNDKIVTYTANDETATINYTTSDGLIISSTQINGKYGNQRNTLASVPNGYHYVTGPESYTFNANMNQIVTVIIAKDETPVKTGQVIINYVDENGNKLADSAIESGDINSQYNIVSPIVAGYTAKQIMVSGIFEPGTKTIQIVYSKNSTPSEPTTPTNNDGNSSQTPYEPTKPTNNEEHGSQTPSEPKTSTDSKGTSTSTKSHNQTSEVTPETTETDGNMHHVLSSDHDGQTNKTVTTSNNNLPKTVTETIISTSTSSVNETATHKTNKTTTLPQTGQSKDNRLLSIIGAILLSVFGIFGLNGFKNKKETK